MVVSNCFRWLKEILQNSGFFSPLLHLCSKFIGCFGMFTVLFSMYPVLGLVDHFPAEVLVMFEFFFALVI